MFKGEQHATDQKLYKMRKCSFFWYHHAFLFTFLLVVFTLIGFFDELVIIIKFNIGDVINEI